MPCIPWFNRVDEDALEEAIRKTKSIRRTSKRRATVPKKQEGGKEKPKTAANKVDVKDVQVREERAQETHAGVQQVNEAYEKVRPTDVPQRDMPQGETPQKDTQKRDVDAPPEVQAGDMPLRQMSAGGSYERDLRDPYKRGHHDSNRRGLGDPSPISKPSKVVDDQEDTDYLDHQPRNAMKSSRLPNLRDLRPTETNEHHGFSRRPGGEPPRTAGAYDNEANFEEEEYSGFQPRNGARSSRHLALSDDDDEDFKEELLRLHRLNLLGSLDQPRRPERERETAVHTGFNSRLGEGDCHIPSSFNKGNDSEEDSKDEEFFETRSHFGPGSSHRPAPNVYGENDPEAHVSRLRRLESLRHSYSPPVDQYQRPSDTTRPARERYNGGTSYRHVHADELDGRETRGHHVSDRRHSLDPQNHGIDYEDDDELPYMPPGGTRPSRRHSHHVASDPPQDEQLYGIQRTLTSRHLAPDPQPARAHLWSSSSTPHQEEPPRRTYHDAPSHSHSRRISQSQIPDDSRYPLRQSQPVRAQSRPPSREPHQKEHSHGRRYDMSCPLYGQRTSQSQRPDNTRRWASVSQPMEAHPKHSREPPRPSPHNRLHFPSSQSVNQDQGGNDSRHPVPTPRSTIAYPGLSSTASTRLRHHDQNQSVTQRQRLQDSRHPAPKSQSTTIHPKPSSTAPTGQRHQNDPHRSSSHSTTQTHQQKSSSQPLPRPHPVTTHHHTPSSRPPRWGQAPSAPTRAPSTTTQRTETSRRSSSGPHLSQKTVLPRVIPLRD